MQPQILQQFLRIVKKPTMQAYLRSFPGESLSQRLEQRIRWASDDSREPHEKLEADFIVKHRAALRTRVTHLADEGDQDEEWVQTSSQGQEFGQGSDSLSNPYMAFQMIQDAERKQESERKQADQEEDEADPLTPLPGGTAPFSTHDFDTLAPMSADNSAPLYPDDPAEATLVMPQGSPLIGSVAAYKDLTSKDHQTHEIPVAEAVDSRDFATPAPARRRKTGVSDGHHIMDDLRAPERVAKVRNILPKNTAQLRPYLLGLLLVSSVPLAYLISQNATGAGAGSSVNPITETSTSPESVVAAVTADTQEVEPIDIFGTPSDNESDKEKNALASDPEAVPKETTATSSNPPAAGTADVTPGTTETKASSTASSKRTNTKPPVKSSSKRSNASKKNDARKEPKKTENSEEAEKEKEKEPERLSLLHGGINPSQVSSQVAIPKMTGTWKGDVKGRSCYVNITSQTGDRIVAKISVEGVDGEDWVEFSVSGRYNSTKKTFRLDAIDGSGALFRATVSENRELFGTAVLHAGGTKMVWTAFKK